MSKNDKKKAPPAAASAPAKSADKKTEKLFVKTKIGRTTFFRAGIEFGKDWKEYTFTPEQADIVKKEKYLIVSAEDPRNVSVSIQEGLDTAFDLAKEVGSLPDLNKISMEDFDILITKFEAQTKKVDMRTENGTNLYKTIEYLKKVYNERAEADKTADDDDKDIENQTAAEQEKLAQEAALKAQEEEEKKINELNKE